MSDPEEPIVVDEYTPTTEEVRERFIDGFPFDTWAVSRDQCGREFDRWLAAHDREVAAKALREAAEATEQEAPGEDYAGATFAAHARWLRAEADRIESSEKGASDGEQ